MPTKMSIATKEEARIEEFKKLFKETFSSHDIRRMKPISVGYTLKLMSLVMDGYEIEIETVLHLKKDSFETTVSVVSSRYDEKLAVMK